jgi:hypothetical protein
VKTPLALAAACVSTALLAAPASADDKVVCLDASSKAQTFRDQHKLVEAQEALRVCARQQCPTVVRNDCTEWLAEVEKSLPTVVVSAKDESGADLVDVTVTVDNAPFAKKLDGSSLPIDPGPHAFHFQAADGTSLDRQVLIKQGEKDQSVAVVLQKVAPAGTTAGAPPASETGAPAGLATQTPEGPPPAGVSNVTRTLGWVSGGLGIAGLVVGGVFGGLAMSAKSSSCDASNSCKAGSIDDIRSKALVSDVGFGVGGVLLATGVALILLSPSTHTDAQVGVRVLPAVGANGAGGVVVGGAW